MMIASYILYMTLCACDQRLEVERLAKEEAERLEAERQAKLLRDEEEKLERKKVCHCAHVSSHFAYFIWIYFLLLVVILEQHLLEIFVWDIIMINK